MSMYKGKPHRTVTLTNPYGHNFYVSSDDANVEYDCGTKEQVLEAVRRLLNNPKVMANHSGGISIDFSPEDTFTVDDYDLNDEPIKDYFDFMAGYDPFEGDGYTEPDRMPEGEPIVSKYMREV